MEAKKVVITVDIYKQVRQMHLEGISQRRIASVLGISRNTVKKYLNGDKVPWERKPYEQRAATVLTPEVKAFIANCLELDKQEGNGKQCHTARRIYDRLVEEMHFTGCASTVRSYVKLLKDKQPAAYVPLAFQPGEALQIDWGEAKVWLGEQKITVELFCARLCYSSAPFVAAYRRQNSESFLEALVRTFEFFGGVPRRVIFDNAKIAVKDGFGAHARTQDTYAALAAHYGFEPTFCNIASGNEKGLVEGLVGFSRRNFCVPLPHVQSMDELNRLLEEQCRKYFAHKIEGKSADVGTLYGEELPSLYPLPSYRYDPAKRAEVKVSSFSTVRCDTNNYSVPVRYCGRTVTVKALPETVEIYCGGEQIASHIRCFGKHQNIYELAHYLPLLARKGRAIFQARPVLDNVPEYFLNWLARQELKPRELVELLERSLLVGFDAVMHGEPALSPQAEAAIQDTVTVAAVDLSAYDALLAQQTREEVCT